MTPEESLDAVKQHAGFAGYTTTSDKHDTAWAAADLRKVLTVQQGGEKSGKDRAMMIN